MPNRIGLPDIALILDMDGVLADTEPVHVRAWDIVLAGVGGEEVAEERMHLAGMSSPDIARKLVELFHLPFTVEELVSRKRGVYRDLISTGLSPFDGLREELALWRKGPLALATSSAREDTMLMLSYMGLDGWFQPVITCDDVKRTKPAPDCYAMAIERLGMPPAQCVVIEDTLHGIQSARGAGARVIAVTTSLPHGPVDGAMGSFPSTVEALQWLRK